MIDDAEAGEIAQEWALACCQTLATRDVEGHMSLISRRGKVYGLADFDFVDYNFWRNQVEEQFVSGLVMSLRYDLSAVKADSDTQVRFTAVEYLTDKDGTEHDNALLVVLTKEADGAWRATEEKILTRDEAQTAGLTRLH